MWNFLEKKSVIFVPKLFLLLIARSVQSTDNSKGTIKSDLTKTNGLSEIHLHKWDGWKIFFY